MRVAYVCADLGVPVFGAKGCSIHVQEIVRSFLKRGDQVELFVARVGGVVQPPLPNVLSSNFHQAGRTIPPAVRSPFARRS